MSSAPQNNASNISTFPGKYKIHDCSVIIPNIDNSLDSRVVDIRNLVKEVNIYQDMYSNFMTADLLIDDPYNLVENIPLAGQEYFRFVWSDQFPIEKEPFETIFNIVAITARGLTAERNQRYALKLVSTEAVRDVQTKISKSFEGRISDIIAKIYTDYLETGKTLYTDETKNQTRVVIPRWSPLKAINFLTQRAVDYQYLKGGFVFFEDLFGFNFFSLNQAVTKEPVRAFRYTPANISKNTRQDQLKNDLERIDSYTVLRSYDTLDQTQRGHLGSTVFWANPTYKEWGTDKLTQKEMYEQVPHLERHKDNTGKTTNPYRVYTDPDSKYVINYAGSLYQDGIEGDFFEQWYQSDLINQGQFNTLKLGMKVVADSYLKVTDVIEVEIPSTLATVPEKSLDKYLSGKYMVTALRHTFTAEKHDMTLEVSKDSLQYGLER